MSLPANSDDRSLAQLFELATPELYRRNAFRVLGLEVEAETGDARRKQKKLKRREALGLTARTTGGYLPLKETPSQEDLQQAQQRIQDPVSRLVDEFFWFWKQDEDDDDNALSLLREKKNQEAHKVFQQREAEGNPTAIHNLAVLYHVTALDLEERAAREPLNEADRKTRDGCWKQCYPRWKQLLEDETTWQRVRSRISELDDPRLTHDLVSQIRESLEEVILLVSARLAVRAAEKNESAEATRHVGLMKSSGFSSDLITQALRRCLAPIEQRIRNLCRKAEEASDADPRVGLEQARGLLAAVVPSIRLIDQMLPADDPLREGIHDEVAKRALQSLITYGNKTEEWSGAKAGMQQILDQLSPSPSMRQRVADNLKTVSDNAQGLVCYYCGKQPAVEADGNSVNMYGDVQTTFSGDDSYRVTWRHTTFKIPRCTSCHEGHLNSSAYRESYTTLGGCAFVLVIILAIVLGNVFQPGEGGMWALVIATAIVSIGLCLALVGYGENCAETCLPEGVRAEGDYNEHPTVVSYHAKGWHYGSGPNSNSDDSESETPRPRATFNIHGSGQQCPGCLTSSYWDGLRCTMCGYIQPGLAPAGSGGTTSFPTASRSSGGLTCSRCNTAFWLSGGLCSLCDAPRNSGTDVQASLDAMIKMLSLKPELMAQVVSAINSGHRGVAAVLLMGSGLSADDAKRTILGWEQRPQGS